jgi:hypothetical protein
VALPRVVECLVAGPGSDFSEVPALGCESVALEPVAAPVCPPGPVPVSAPEPSGLAVMVARASLSLDPPVGFCLSFSELS